MNRLGELARSVLPAPIKRGFKRIHRDFVFRRALKQFTRSPELHAQPGNPLLLDLIYGWGNESWSAGDEYLTASLRRVLASSGPTLECGSGLTTLLVGVIAKSRGQSHWALEHSPEWAMRLRRFLIRYRLASAVTLCIDPLRD